MIPVISHPRCVLLHGDAADLPRALSPRSIDSMVTDPPSGTGFMGAEWDSPRGGRVRWVDWLAGVMQGALGVMKPGAHGLVWALPRTSHWTGTALELAGFEIRDVIVHLFGQGMTKGACAGRQIDMLVCREPGTHCDKTLRRGAPDPHLCPEHPLGDQHRGEHTGLKPAAEHWILVRRPLEETLAECVLKWGTGALQVDESRSIEAPRRPANVILDEDVAYMLDAGQPPSRSRRGKPRRGTAGAGWGAEHTGAEYDDAGGPSRFFYVSKPTRAERDEGLGHLPWVSAGKHAGRKEGSAGLSARAGAGRSGGGRNTHPTVKRVTLMEYLTALVTPPGGLVLDQFAGSGSTGVAALRRERAVVCVEREEKYMPIIEGRLRHELARVEEEERAA